jgi:hypothetical protein
MGVVALVAAALDPRIEAVAMVGSPVTFVGDGPWSGLSMGIVAPNLLDTGDIGHLAALVAPRKLAIAGGVEPSGRSCPRPRVEEAFAFARRIYALQNAPTRLTFADSADWPAILPRWLE